MAVGAGVFVALALAGCAQKSDGERAFDNCERWVALNHPESDPTDTCVKMAEVDVDKFIDLFKDQGD